MYNNLISAKSTAFGFVEMASLHGMQIYYCASIGPGTIEYRATPDSASS